MAAARSGDKGDLALASGREWPVPQKAEALWLYEPVTMGQLRHNFAKYVAL